MEPLAKPGAGDMNQDSGQAAYERLAELHVPEDTVNHQLMYSFWWSGAILITVDRSATRTDIMLFTKEHNAYPELEQILAEHQKRE